MRRMDAIKTLVLIVVLLGSVLLLPAQPARAENLITVNVSTDSYEDDDYCSLREAIMAANNNDPLGFQGCDPGIAGTDTITFANNFTMTLEDKLPIITDSLIIRGNGRMNTSIQASGCNPITLPGSCTPANYSVFEAGGGIALTLDSVTVRYGRNIDPVSGYGGAVRPPNSGSYTLSIIDSLINYNYAAGYGGGVASRGGTITVNNSKISENEAGIGGGGLYASTSGTEVNIIRSTISQNHAEEQGGGLDLNTNVTGTITKSLIYDNDANSGSAGSGGGVHALGTLTVSNSTISGNSAHSTGGGVYSNWGTLTLRNVTISNNSAASGGGVYVNTSGTLAYLNTIIGNSTGGDCQNLGTQSSNVRNITEDNSCSPWASGDPKLDVLANNSGPTLTHDLLPTSPAIGNGNATVCSNAPVSNKDQRNVDRPQGTGCDIGAVEYIPCRLLTLAHTGTGSNPVASPLNSAGCGPGKYLAGQSITLTAAPAVRWHVGSWSGTTNNSSTALTNHVTMPDAPHTAGVNYKPNLKTLKLYSQASYDGWVLELSETSGIGGTMNASNTNFIVGDNAADKQYRAFLSFNTAQIPSGAVITKVTLKIKKIIIVGKNPFITHGTLKVDLKKPYFGVSEGLAIHDFQALATKGGVATFGETPTNNWYTAVFGATARANLNRSGMTQFRLRFLLDDNDDRGADYIKFYSSNAATTVRPVLTITYYIP